MANNYQRWLCGESLKTPLFETHFNIFWIYKQAFTHYCHLHEPLLAQQIICGKILFSHTQRWYQFLFLYFFIFRFFLFLLLYVIVNFYKNYIIIIFFFMKIIFIFSCSRMFRNVLACSGMPCSRFYRRPSSCSKCSICSKFSKCSSCSINV